MLFLCPEISFWVLDKTSAGRQMTSLVSAASSTFSSASSSSAAQSRSLNSNMTAVIVTSPTSFASMPPNSTSLKVQHHNPASFNSSTAGGVNHLHHSSVAANLSPTNLSYVPSLRLKTSEFMFKWMSMPRGELILEALEFVKSQNKIPKPTDLVSYKVSKLYPIEL